MRIAATGTHSIGKSTFIEDFLIQYSDYIREMEPYRVLRPCCINQLFNRRTTANFANIIFYKIQAYLG